MLPTANALGTQGCGECHAGMNSNQPTKVFDRLILVDFAGTDGKPVYKKLREITGVDPF